MAVLDPNVNIMNIVNWFRVRNGEDIRFHYTTKRITQMKVMKLLYYVQGVSLVVYNLSAFSDPIFAWKYGPAVESVHKKYRGFTKLPKVTRDDIKNCKNIIKGSKLYQIISTVYREYRNMTAIDMMNKTHKEYPWLSTPQSSIIPNTKIKNYFSKHILTL